MKAYICCEMLPNNIQIKKNILNAIETKQKHNKICKQKLKD